MESSSTAARPILLLAYSILAREMGVSIFARMAAAARGSDGSAASPVACRAPLWRGIAVCCAKARAEARRHTGRSARGSTGRALSVLPVQCRVLFFWYLGCYGGAAVLLGRARVSRASPLAKCDFRRARTRHAGADPQPERCAVRITLCRAIPVAGTAASLSSHSWYNPRRSTVSRGLATL